MSLALEIEFLAGVAFSAVSPDGDVPDWPPQPDRIFSGLVATWAARGRRDEEAAALRWLEELPTPSIAASRAWDRTPRLSFVPANDAASDRRKHALHVLPQLRNRQPRRFPAARLQEPAIWVCWPRADADDATLSALQALAGDTAYIGHSASLTRCRFVPVQPPVPALLAPAVRGVYPGRFDELQAAFARGARPDRGVWVRPPEGSTPQAPEPVFGSRWLILEALDSATLPDVRAAALVSRAIRARIAEGYAEASLQAPEVVTGRGPDGSPARAPHLAVVPLAFAGFPHADGHLLGFGLVPPRGGKLFDDDDFRRALRAIAPTRSIDGRRVMKVSLPGLPDATGGIEFSPTFEPSLASLDPAGYVALDGRPCRTYATVTPIALDRHPKQTGADRQGEVAGIIGGACAHIGLPILDTMEGESQAAIVPDKHSAVEGMPPAGPATASPPWMGWRLPPPLAGRVLTHAVIQFAEPVAGPVILGAGRYFGLGLCRPVRGPGGDG